MSGLMSFGEWGHSEGRLGRLQGHDWKRLLPFLIALVLMVSLCGWAQAQQLPGGMTVEQAKQLLQQGAATNSATSPPQTVPQVAVVDNPAPSPTVLPSSDLETLMSRYSGSALKQFGYDQVGSGRAVTVSQVGALQDSYVLGPGDEIIITFRGQENSEFRTEVDRDGRVIVPKLAPLSAAGRTLGDFRKSLNTAARTAFVETHAFVSLGQVRQVSVLVTGEVGNPGVRTLTGLSTVIDAVLVSGGIKKTGSLRNIRVLRNGHDIVVDLYSMLLGRGTSKIVVLTDGDKVVVPSIGATVAVAGAVRRPAIYEMAPGQRAMSTREVVSVAGGTLSRGVYALSLLRILPDGKRQLVDVTASTDKPIREGEVVIVRNSVDVAMNQVTLVGAVRSPGYLALGKYRTLRDVLSSSDVLRPGAYLLLGVIDRTDPKSLQRSLMPFSPIHVLEGKENLDLMSDDVIRILTLADEQQLMASVLTKEGAEIDPAGGRRLTQLGQPDASATPPASANAAVQQPLAQAPTGLAGTFQQGGGPASALPASNGGDQGLSGAQQTNSPSVAASPAAAAQVAPPAGSASGSAPSAGSEGAFTAADSDYFGAKIGDNRISIYGAVSIPGTYLVARGTTLSEVLDYTGGLNFDVDRQQFELTSTQIDNASGISSTSRSFYPATEQQFASLILKPYDRVEFRRVFSDKAAGVVTVSGQVRYPGNFTILRAETLGSVLRRAGGATEVAYPEGAVFTRKSVAEAQAVEKERIAGDLRSQLLAYLTQSRTSTDAKPDAASVAAVEALIERISSTPALGRVPVVANLDLLARDPALDILLEPGDKIVIPKRPSTVLVVGEVVQPGAQRYSGSRSPDAYVDLAGGTTALADTGRIVVVLPDGSVRTDDSSWLNFGFSAKIPPGSTIYVPRMLETYTFHSMFVDTIQIFSQLATTAAALAVLSKQ